MASMQEVFGPQLDRLLTELKKQARQARLNMRYYEGRCPFPQAVVDAKMKRAYRTLMPMSVAPWASLAVDSVADRLEVEGVLSGDSATPTEADKAVWRLWQENAMDAESKLAHAGALSDGRAFATVWPAEASPRDPEIVLDGAEQMVVQYREGRHQPRHRVAALRSWSEGSGTDKVEFATLYRPEGIYKFESALQAGSDTVDANGTPWKPREIPGEDWPVPNPWGRVPVVEIAVNRRLKPGPFPYARGEFQDCIGLLDQINLLTFLGLVVALWMGFPLRGVIGQKLARKLMVDDDGDPILDDAGKQQHELMPPWESKPDTVAGVEAVDAKVFEFKAADRKNLSVFDELAQFAMLTKTPRHYFPQQGGISNVSADMIRADEGALAAKVRGLHQPFLGEGWEEVLRLGGMMLDTPVELPPSAEVQWADHESRSMAERADAFVKVASVPGFPLAIAVEKFLNFTQAEAARFQVGVAGSAITNLLNAATSTASVDVGTTNGGGTVVAA